MELQVSFPGKARVDVSVNGFVIRTDQPREQGGDGAAPAPFDYFLASLATCAGFFVLRFLQQRGLPTEDAGVVLDTARDARSHLVTDVTVRVLLPEGFPEKYRRAIVRAVDGCSVKRHLETPPRFETVVEIGGRVGAAEAGAGYFSSEANQS